MTADDVDKLTYDEDEDVWYECLYDIRKRTYTWTILPPSE
jgi:hypothetical protein